MDGMLGSEVFEKIETTCLWTDHTKAPEELGKDTLPRTTDVAIVGSGYTGLIAALQLARAGAKVVVMEQRTLGWGASTRNGGKALVGLKPDAETLIKRYGKDLASRLWLTSKEGMVQEEKIECDFERYGSFQGACKPGHYQQMQKTTELLEKVMGYRRINIDRKDVKNEIGTDSYHGGVVDPISAGFHPAKYAYGLARAAKRAGSLLCERTSVQGISRHNNGFEVETREGRIRATEVLVATNAYTGTRIPVGRNRVIPLGSYIIATEPLSAEIKQKISPRNRMFYDSKWLLNYYRLTPDGRMLFGGRASFSTSMSLRKSAIILRRQMAGLFPELENTHVTHSWMGSVGMTFSMLPYIGKANGIHYALGYNGHGSMMSAYLGQKVSEMIRGGTVDCPFLEIKQPTYFFYKGWPWFRPFLGFGIRFLDWLT